MVKKRAWRYARTTRDWDSTDQWCVWQHHKAGWIVFKPPPRATECLQNAHGKPRRWKTAEAAMKAVDREYPR